MMNLGDRDFFVNEILTSGRSVVEAAQKIESCDLEVRNIVVFIDH